MWLTPNPALSIIPGYLLQFQNYKVQKKYLFSVNIHLAMSIPYVTETVLQG